MICSYSRVSFSMLHPAQPVYRANFSQSHSYSMKFKNVRIKKMSHNIKFQLKFTKLKQ